MTRIAAPLIALCVTLAAGPALSQVSSVAINVDPQDVGLGGSVAPAQWNAMRVSIDYAGQQPRQVECRWLVADRDGDRVIASREVALNPQRADQRVWLYAPVPRRQGRNPAWLVQVVSEDGQTVLASTRAGARRTLDQQKQTIGVMASAALGLDRYTDRATRHEAIELIRGLELADLPDRWHGLAPLEALIWTPQGGRPVDTAVPDASLDALREWVRRGGHLILSIPAVNQTWSDSTLADLLPLPAEAFRQRTDLAPPAALGPVRGEASTVDLTVFNAPATDDAAVIARDDQGNPFIVAGRRGFGRVTLIGLDLTSPPVTQMGLPFGRYRIWNDIFRWQGPVFSQSFIEQQRKQQQMDQLSFRNEAQADRFIPGLIAMRETAAPMLMGAVLLFALYWLLAGPISFLVLKKRGLTHYSWLGFVAVVGVFLIVSWAGALVTRPATRAISHFSVVSARAGSDLVHTRSWFSLFVPEFGQTDLALAPDQPEAPNTLAAPGLPWGPGSAGFTDQRRYSLDAPAPNRAAIPFRATAKQLQLNYHGPLSPNDQPLPDSWVMPQGELRIENHWPVGQLSHGLPRPLHDVLLVYCPGDGEMPWVWRHTATDGAWAPNELLDVADRPSVARLVKKPAQYTADRNWRQEGFLGQLIARKAGQQFMDLTPTRLTATDSELIKAIEMLSFYQALPPPNFRDTDGSANLNITRSLGRALDLTHLTHGRRLILIGYMKQAPMPAPLSVEGDAVPSQGWTVVRWIYDFTDNNSQ